MQDHSSDTLISLQFYYLINERVQTMCKKKEHTHPSVTVTVRLCGSRYTRDKTVGKYSYCWQEGERSVFSSA